MGKLIAINISEKRGTEKKEIQEAQLVTDFGIAGDAHAGKWHRQVSLLSFEKIEDFKARGARIENGAFGENLIVSGFDFKTLPLGTRFQIGDALLEMTQIGKQCHSHCAIYQRMGECIMPKEGVFAVVLKGGRVGASPYGITEMEGLFFVIGEERILMSRWREGAPFKVGLSGFREWQPDEPKEKTAEKGAAAETAAQKEVREAAAAQAEQNSQTAAQEMAQRKQGGAATVQSEQNSRMAAKGMAQDVPSGSRVETAAAGEEMEAIHATELPMRNLFPEYDWNAVWEELCREHKPVALFEEWDMQCIQLELKDLRSLPKKYWYLGNNSFLLHGFFNYRYLLLGRTAEERWFLGVPGVYQRQERVMAAIFGFPEFFAAGPGGERGALRCFYYSE